MLQTNEFVKSFIELNNLDIDNHIPNITDQRTDMGAYIGLWKGLLAILDTADFLKSIRDTLAGNFDTLVALNSIL